MGRELLSFYTGHHKELFAYGIKAQTMYGRRTFAECELCFHFFRVETLERRTIDPLASGSYKGKIHPTQKPVKLYEWLLANYAKEGDRILDTHLGSGSSAIAAHYGGFDFVGIELDEDYYKAAKKRFESETAQGALF